jgi:ABC-type Mn2+/Zn2+ transport system permease subunit
MKKRNSKFYFLLPVVITLALYVVFYERIASKPSEAGFWIILVLGMSIGIALTRFFSWSNTQNK